ncbi:MAG: TIGR00730 family Rossman fold protein, partial [Allorhizobium sp.]
FANINDFWKPMLELVDHMSASGFIHTAHLVRPLVIDRIEDIVPAIHQRWAETEAPEGDPETISKL